MELQPPPELINPLSIQIEEASDTESSDEEAPEVRPNLKKRRLNVLPMDSI